MSRYWTPSKRRLLITQAKTLTVKQICREHGRPKKEIETVCLELGIIPIKDIYIERRARVTVYYPAFAYGVMQQHRRPTFTDLIG